MQTRNVSLRLIWLLHLPLCSQCHGTHLLWTDRQHPTAVRLILKPLLHPCLVSKPKACTGHSWQMMHLPRLQAETLQPVTLHKIIMTSGIRHSISQQSQAKLTSNCLLGKQQMCLTADSNRILAERIWTQVTYHDDPAYVLFNRKSRCIKLWVLSNVDCAAFNSPACVARHLCSRASDSSAQR